MPNTALGFPYPAGTDPPAGHTQIQSLAAAVDLQPGVGSYTQAQITAFTVGEKRAGRVVWNSTTSTLQRCDGSTWVDLDIATTAIAEARVTGLTAALAAKAALASPTFTGTPAAPTAAVRTDTTQVATTAFVQANADPSIRLGVGPNANYTFVLADNGTLVASNVAATFTVPPNSSVPYPLGAHIYVWQQGAGVITLAPGAGVTLYAASLVTGGLHGGRQLINIGTDLWWVI